MTAKTNNLSPIQAKLDSLWDRIPPLYKLSFFATFILGWLANMYAFTNPLINHDTVNEGYQDLGLDFLLTQGRWLQYPCRLFGNKFPSPIVHGFFGITALALSAAVIVAIFQLSDRISVLLLSALLATFPINACFFSYMYMSHIYYISLLFAVLAVYFVEKDTKLGFCIAAASTMCSVAIYQSFISITVALVVVIYFIRLINSEPCQLKKWFLGGLRDAAMVIVGYALYGVFTKILLAIRGVELRSYLGTDKTFSFSFSDLPFTMQITLTDIKTFYLTTIWVHHKGFVLANLFMFFVFAALSVWAIVKHIQRRQYARIPLILIYLCIMPFLIDNIYIMMNMRGTVHMLMHYDYLVPYIMLLALLPVLQQFAFTKVSSKGALVKHAANALTFGSLLVVVAISYYGFIITNQLYTRMDNNMTAINSSLTTMMARIEQEEGWNPSQPVFIVNGHGLLNSALSATQDYYQELGTTLWIGTDDYEWGNSSQMYLYISRYFNLTLQLPTDEQCQDILSSNEYAEMDIFPAESSIRTINGVVVVKMDNE